MFVLTEVALSTDSSNTGIHNIYNTHTYRGVKTGSQIHVLIDSDMDKNETCLFYIHGFHLEAKLHLTMSGETFDFHS